MTPVIKKENPPVPNRREGKRNPFQYISLERKLFKNNKQTESLESHNHLRRQPFFFKLKGREILFFYLSSPYDNSYRNEVRRTYLRQVKKETKFKNRQEAASKTKDKIIDLYYSN